MVFAQFWLGLNVLFEAHVIVQQPAENRILNFLIILLFEELIMEKLDGTNDEEFSSPGTSVKCSNRSVRWETDGTTGQHANTWLTDIERGSIRIHKLKSAILVSAGQIVLGVPIFLSIRAWFIFFVLLSSIGASKE